MPKYQAFFEHEISWKMTNLNLNAKTVTFFKDDIKPVNKLGFQKTLIKSEIILDKLPSISIHNVIPKIEKYFSEIKADPNARYLSWEHCYRQFSKIHNEGTLNPETLDLLSLHLAFYLESCGMIRGAQFLAAERL